MKTSSMELAGAAFVLVGGLTLVPGLGMFALAPLAAAVIGAIAAWRAASESGSAGQGTRAALTVGVGALLGTAVCLTVAAVVLGSNPAIQEFVRASEPHPEARIPYEWMTPLAAATGIFVGLLDGFGNLVVSVVAGLVAGLLAAGSGSQPRQTA